MTIADQARARELFDYDAETGFLHWRTRPVSDFETLRACSTWNASFVGKKAGCLSRFGYFRIGFKGRSYLAHRLVWLYVNGSWAIGEIDHIDHDRLNNRIENLRDVSRSDNQRNRSAACVGASGAIGVRWEPGRMRWLARIKVDGVSKNLGRFETREMAVAARQAAERGHGFHPNHGLDIGSRKPA